MRITWSPSKAATNAAKHGVTFEDAAGALFDPLAVTGDDPDHSFEERRYVTFALSTGGQLLSIAHTIEVDVIRIISARLATKRERKLYEEG